GPAASSGEGRRLVDAQWRVEVDQLADVVIAQVGGEPQLQTFDALARALACASRVVKPDGRIVLVSSANPELGEGGALLRQADTPDEGLTLLQECRSLDRAAAFQWSQAARQAKLYLLSHLPADVAEELFTTPLENA